MTEKEFVSEFRNIRSEYEFNPDIMCPDEPRVARLKEIIDTKLSLADKIIIISYCDCMSFRKLGEKMHMSHMSARREVMRIRGIILSEYNRK